MILALLFAAALAQPPGDFPVAQPLPERAAGEYLIPGLPPGPAPDPTTVDDTTYEISSMLRCPVCQGLSAADSTADAAVMFQRNVREMVREGYTREQIIDFFVATYGEWIILEPAPKGLDWVIYIAPAAAGGLGLIWAVVTVLQWSREDEEDPHVVGVVAPTDPYEQRLLAELENE